ncbi:MAG: hypothetical protein U0822_24510 [Anaerolineae bacterium]
MSPEHPRYVAYMLRLWEVGGEDGPVWRISLESPHTGERQVFTSLESLFTFLRAELAGSVWEMPDEVPVRHETYRELGT